MDLSNPFIYCIIQVQCTSGECQMKIKGDVGKNLLIIGVVLLLGLFITYKINTRPSLSLVNGTYVNACCVTVIMRDGLFLYGSQHIRYNLYHMKFGLTAYIKGVLTHHDIQVAEQETALSFFDDDRGRGFTTVVEGRDYTFTEQK